MSLIPIQVFSCSEMIFAERVKFVPEFLQILLDGAKIGNFTLGFRQLRLQLGLRLLQGLDVLLVKF